MKCILGAIAVGQEKKNKDDIFQVTLRKLDEKGSKALAFYHGEVHPYRFSRDDMYNQPQSAYHVDHKVCKYFVIIST
jgi:hypothetical protein